LISNIFKVQTLTKRIKTEATMPDQVKFFHRLIPHQKLNEIIENFKITIPSNENGLQNIKTVYDHVLKQYYEIAGKFGFVGTSSDNIYRHAQGSFKFEVYFLINTLICFINFF